MPIRNCPVCKVGKIVRKDVKTCGAPECIELWKHMSMSQRARAIDDAAIGEVRNLDDFQPTFNKPMHSPTAPDSTTQRDNEALEKIFGADAPGIIKKDEGK